MVSTMGAYTFDLLIEPAADGYRVRVLDSPAGQSDGLFHFPFTHAEIEALQGWGLTQQSGLTPEEFGRRLFAAIFTGGVGECLRRSLDRAGEGTLRINLRLDDAPELAPLPWEFLFDPENERYLALSERSPIVRYLSLPLGEETLRVRPPLRVLAVLSDPSGSPAPVDVSASGRRFPARCNRWNGSDWWC